MKPKLICSGLTLKWSAGRPASVLSNVPFSTRYYLSKGYHSDDEPCYFQNGVLVLAEPTYYGTIKEAVEAGREAGFEVEVRVG